MTILRVKYNKFIKIKTKMVNKTSKNSKIVTIFFYPFWREKGPFWEQSWSMNYGGYGRSFGKPSGQGNSWTLPLYLHGFIFYLMLFWGFWGHFPRGKCVFWAPLLSLLGTVVLRNAARFLKGKWSATALSKRRGYDGAFFHKSLQIQIKPNIFKSLKWYLIS